MVGTLGRAGAVAGAQAPGHPTGARQRKVLAAGGPESARRGGQEGSCCTGVGHLAYGPGPRQGHPSEWRRRPDSSPHTDGPGSSGLLVGSAPAGPAGSPGERLHPRPTYLCPSRCPPEVPAWGTARFTALPLPIQAPSVLRHLSRLTPLRPVCSWVTEMASCPCPSLFPWADGPPGTAQALRGLMSQETLDRAPSEP